MDLGLLFLVRFHIRIRMPKNLIPIMFIKRSNSISAFFKKGYDFQWHLMKKQAY